LNNGGDAVAIGANGTFKFATNVATGGAYAVTVQSHTPGVGCDISNGSGTVGGAAVSSVVVTCRTGIASLVYAFDGSLLSTDGQFPASSLFRDSAGNFYGTTSGGGLYLNGTVFKITPSGSYTSLYSFNASDGNTPYAGLVADRGGNLYGTTFSGGANGFGAVFKITPAGTHTVLYSFGAGAADGKYPYGGLAIDSAGNLYGTTSAGGTNNLGTVFKITSAGTKSTIYSFSGAPNDGQSPYGSVLLDSSGNLYGTTTAGGANSIGTVFKVTPGGIESVVYSFDGAQLDGQAPYSGLVIDASGNLYGTTLNGGAHSGEIVNGNTNNGGTVFKISPAGVYSVLYAFSGAVDGQQPYAGLLLDSAGNLYGATSAGGGTGCSSIGCGTVFKISASGAFSVLYAFDSNLSVGQSPWAGLVIDGEGNIYGTTSGDGARVGGTVFKID
jgi:uncharacterized repeat protein (TIGR03803 family)